MEAAAAQLDDMNVRIARIREFAGTKTDVPDMGTDTWENLGQSNAEDSIKDDMRFLLGLIE
jgi:hypothetical protein